MNDGHKHTHSALDTRIDAHEPLSPRGQARRDAMLGLLEAAVRTRGRRRLAARSSLAACGFALAVGAVVLVTKPSPTTPTTPPPPITPTAPISLDIPRPELPFAVPTAEPTTPPASSPPPTAAPRLVTYVTNDPDILTRWAAPARPSRVEMLDDEELLAKLRAVGLPAGIIRQENTITIAFHNAPLPSTPVPHAP